MAYSYYSSRIWQGRQSNQPLMSTSYEMRRAALDGAEKELRGQMAREHGSPFIGHHDLPAPMRQAAEHALVTEIGGSIDDFLDYVAKRLGP